MTESKQTLHIVIGMPGSGKTTYLQKLLAEGTVDKYFDDYQKGAPEEDRSNPRLSPNFADLKAAMAAGNNVAIADIRYCLPEEETLVRGSMRTEFPESDLVLSYFANDPEACRHNVRLRNREEHFETELQNIETMTSRYAPPQSETLPVIMG